MFKYEECIQNWRNAIAKDETLKPEDLAELEDHLRTDFVQLKETGLNDQEAFWLAEKRLGDTSTICREYKKVNHATIWANRLQWMLIGYLFLGVLSFTKITFVNVISTLTLIFGSELVSAIAYIVSEALLVGGLVYAGYSILYGGGSHQEKLARLLQALGNNPKRVIVVALSCFGLFYLTNTLLLSRIVGAYLSTRDINSFSMLTHITNILYPLIILSLLFFGRHETRPTQQIA